jgi:hypothetical protein
MPEQPLDLSKIHRNSNPQFEIMRKPNVPEQSMIEKQRIMMDVVSQLKEHTGPSLSKICGARSEDTGELVGSGTVVELRGKPYLLTAEHVAKQLFAENTDGSRKFPEGLCHSLDYGEQMAWIPFPWFTWPTPKDIAATRIDPVVLEATRVVPLKATRFADNTDSLNDDLYFIHGWPGKESRFTTFFDRGVVSTSQPYGGWLTNKSSWPQFDPKVHFAITYPMTELIDEHGQPAKLPLPGGMSGSLIWKSNRVGAKSGWTPEMATVAGLAHRFDESEQCLIATRIEYVKGLLLSMLRNDYAYFRWIERGRPMGDDWADWFAAENEVTSL